MGIGASTLPLINACTTKETHKKKEFGVQIYSVREQLMQDFEGTLQKIADMGYDYIEAFGLGTDGKYFGQTTPAELKAMVEGMGMRIESTHTSYFTADDAPVMVGAAQAAGVKQLIIPYLTEDQRTDYTAHAANLNAVGKYFKEAGIEFGYHNHDFEFRPLEDGTLPMEILLNNTDAGLVNFQLDVYWITYAGLKAEEFIAKHPGRFTSYHVKDADQELAQTTVGEGIIDYNALLAKNEEFGIKYVFVEDERTDNPLANITAAHDYLDHLTF